MSDLPKVIKITPGVDNIPPVIKIEDKIYKTK